MLTYVYWFKQHICKQTLVIDDDEENKDLDEGDEEQDEDEDEKDEKENLYK